MKLFGYEITFKKVNKKRGPNLKGARRWSTSEIGTALRLRNEGVELKEIGRRLNRSTQAVQVKLHTVSASK